MRNTSKKLIYFVLTFFIFMLLLKLFGWIENEYLPLNTQTQLISLFIIIPAIVILSFILSSLIFKGLEEAK